MASAAPRALSPPTALTSVNSRFSSASATTTETFSNTPFQIIVNSGSNQVAQINGTIFGSVGPASSAAPTYTITSVVANNNSGTDGNPLFTITPPSVPMNLNTNLPSGTLAGGPAAATDLTFAVTVPEPASVVVFAASLGVLGLYARRRRSA